MNKSKNLPRIARRQLLGQAATLAALAGFAAPQVVPAAVAGKSPPRWRQVRRVVTSFDGDGRSVVLSDGPAGNSFEMNGTRITRLWEQPGLPVDLPLGPDRGATAGNAYRADFSGTSFYLAELPGRAHPAPIPLHASASLDYMAILSGRIAFLLDAQRELVLEAGDTLVQGGNLHTWVNRWREPCMLLFVVVTGQGRAPAPG